MSTKQQGACVVVRGGAGAGRELDDGCASAAATAISRLSAGQGALEAAIAASVMDTRGRLGAVSCLRGVKNPVLVARCEQHTALPAERGGRRALRARNGTRIL